MSRQQVSTTWQSPKQAINLQRHSGRITRAEGGRVRMRSSRGQGLNFRCYRLRWYEFSSTSWLSDLVVRVCYRLLMSYLAKSGCLSMTTMTTINGQTTLEIRISHTQRVMTNRAFHSFPAPLHVSHIDIIHLSTSPPISLVYTLAETLHRLPTMVNLARKLKSLLSKDVSPCFPSPFHLFPLADLLLPSLRTAAHA
jgi:hypothetical protein